MTLSASKDLVFSIFFKATNSSLSVSRVLMRMLGPKVSMTSSEYSICDKPYVTKLPMH
jgi:hypothetical protein